MKKALMIAGMFCACSAFADPVVINGNYTLNVGDAKSYSGDYVVTGEFQPKDGSEIDGSNWHVEQIVAFQQNGISMTLRSGTLVVDTWGSHAGCYPNNGASYINFAPGSTAKVTMACASTDVYSGCFASGRNFRVNDAVLTAEEFADKIKLEVVDETHTTFSLNPPAATDVVFGKPTAVFANDTATVTASIVAQGDGSAQVYAVWDTSDKGSMFAAWGNHTVTVGSLADFASSGAVLTGLPPHMTVVLRVFAVTGSGEFSSSPVSLFTLSLRAENQPLPNNQNEDFVVTNDALGYEQKNSEMKKLVLRDGSYVFPGSHLLSVYDGAWIDNSYVQFWNRIENKSPDVTFAVTNSYVQYRGTNGNDPSPFTTGSGKDGVRVEMVNTTGHAEGMLWDCMTDGLKIGLNASGCSFLADGGGVSRGTVVTNMNHNRSGFHVGTVSWGVTTGASRNSAVIRNGAEVWDNITVNNAGNSVGAGNGSNENTLDIIGGEGFVTKLYKGYPGSIGSDAATGNVVRVDGKGFPGSAVWDNRSETLAVGRGGAFSNSLYIVDGGVVSGPVVNVGNNAVSNLVVVSGDGSVLRGSDGSTAITVGTGGSSANSEGNRLIVENGGVVERFAKWSTVIGGHENNEMTGSSKDNGVIVRSGGKFKLANHLRIGQIKGAGSITKGNFVHVQGEGSEVVQTGGYREIYIGAATLSGDPGAEACENELVVSDGGVVTAWKYFVGDSVSETAPGASHDNRIVARANGKIAATELIQVGLSADASRGAEEAVVVDNKVIAEFGGIIEAKKLATISGNGNAIIARNGGVLQFYVTEPGIEPFEEGAIAIDSGVISYRMDNCTPKTVETSTKDNSWQALTVTGRNAFRLAECQTRDWDNSYIFGDTEPANPRHFVRLEMIGGTTAWRGGASDTLTIDATGSMLCSNTTASVKIPCALNGALTLVDSTLALEATTTLGSGFSLTIGGELESGRDVITSVSDLNLQATLPECWRLRKRATETGFAYYTEYRKPGLAVIVR